MLYFAIFFQNPDKERQSSTLELINGLVSLVHQQVIVDVAQESMEVMIDRYFAWHWNEFLNISVNKIIQI